MSRPAATHKRAYAFCIIPALAVVAVAMLVFYLAQHRTTNATSRSKSTTQFDHSQVQAKFASLPVAFERNDGQTDPEIRYMARGQGYKLYLTSSEAIFTLHKRGEYSDVRAMLEHKRLGPSRVQKILQHQKRLNVNSSEVSVLHLKHLGSNPAAQIASADPVPGKVNYFIGNDPSRWRSSVPLFGRVSYQNLYPGIDLAFHGSGKQLEFDYLISPGADPRAIALGFQGAENVRTNGAGDLVLTTPAGPIKMLRPTAYQEKDGARRMVAARFEVKNGRRVDFSLGPYDHTRELIIDPTVTYSTYFGGDFADYGLSIVSDANGNSFVAGSTDSDSGTIPGTLSGTVNGTFDIFVTEINSAGVLQFTSLLVVPGTTSQVSPARSLSTRAESTLVEPLLRATSR